MTKRYQRDNQNMYIRQHNDQKIPKGQSESVYQTTQWPKDTKGAIRICISDNTMTKRYQRANQNLYIRQHNDQKIPKGQSESVYQTTQWPKDTKGVIRICISDNTMTKIYQRANQNLYIRQHNDQKIPRGQSESVYQTTQWPKDTKGVIRICISDNTMTKGYQRDNQNMYIRQHNDQKIPRDNQNMYIRQHNDQKIPKGQSESVHQTTQWPKDTKAAIRICISDNTMTKRYQRGNHNLYIRQHNDQKIPKGQSEPVYQTTQWPKDTKGAIRICISDNTMTKRYQRIIRICISDNTMAKRYQRENQNMYIRQHHDQKIPKGQSEYVYQTTQWPKDTKGAIRICISENTMTKRYQRGNKNLHIRKHNGQKTPKGQSESVYHTTQWPKDTKGTIRIRLSDNKMTKRYQRDNHNLYIRQYNDQKIPKG